MEQGLSSSQLSKEREQYRAQIATALQEDPDPLTAYDGFVKWTLDNYPREQLSHSGLIELLEEATRRFKDDTAYKGDLRYLKIWSLYASHVEDPTTIYAFLLAHDIGTVYAQTYWEYATALERSGRRPQAEAIYQQGIQRRARPVEPLRRRYEEFKGRSGAPPLSASDSSLWKTAPPQTQALRRDPLMNHSSNKPSVQESSSSSSSALAKHTHDRYAPMLAPPVPGKRPEKLRFNLSLLFTEDGTEYSMQEARARSMGLLGKKWGPPPPSEVVRIDFKDGPGTRGTRTLIGRKGFAGGEPTVTLATKEALADVFGMYNSPEKSMRFGAVAGSKHAPVRKVDPVTPVALQSQFRAVSNENANVPAKTPTFQPFVDENVKRKENNMPAPPSKFKPFVDSEPPSKLPTFTPQLGRRALSIKESTTPAPKSVSDKNAHALKPPNVLKPISEESRPAAVFSTVFTPLPAAQKDRPQIRRDVFIEEQARGNSANTSPLEGVNVFQAPVKVFSRPPSQNENAPVAQASVFKPFVDAADANKMPAAPSTRAVLSERTPFQAFTPRSIPGSQEQQHEDDTDDTDEDPYDEYGEQGAEFDNIPAAQEGEDSMYDDDPVEDADYHAPLGGRFGQFNVMTPITERTFEHTASTRASGTPNGMLEGIQIYRDPVETAELLAAELREDDQQRAESATALLEEKTGALSLSDALSVASTFKPPNPCNPFDPPIVSTLLSLIPADHGFHDLRQQEANQLNALQKFAKQKTRRTSGNTTSTRLMEQAETLEVSLFDRRFSVTDKLGEGGFGAVFEAKDLHMITERDDEDEDEELDEKCKVALKVVKPRNLWEFHVLRRIHRTLPAHLRRSVITPQALYAFGDESFLVLELCKQGTLLDIVNRASQAGITQQGACLDELLVMFFAIELMRLLEGLHNAGFIHGDVKIDNCLLRLEDVPGPASAWSSAYQPSGEGGWSYKGIKMIDFGRTIDTRLFPAGQRYVAEWPTDARDCLDMREGRPWTFQTDYFGLAGIIYCMLYGKYIEAPSVVPASAAEEEQRYKLSTPFKRYWQTGSYPFARSWRICGWRWKHGFKQIAIVPVIA
ncbi:hypothetical protein AcV5_008647 [Taiwanofungus camphoratus]|nr:hypothetical protein AcV5_008647 [Antrodia cinnamomea]